MRAIAVIVVLSIIAAAAVMVAVGQLAQVKPDVCARLGKLIDVDRDRVLRSRNATQHQTYYLHHPDELRAYIVRSRQSVTDLEGVRC